MSEDYEIVCVECGKTFHTSNPRVRKCVECKSAVIHRRLKEYYKNVLKDKRQKANKERRENGVEAVCSVCGSTFITDDRRHKKCPNCLKRTSKTNH